jgi:hypothetical protein
VINITFREFNINNNNQIISRHYAASLPTMWFDLLSAMLFKEYPSSSSGHKRRSSSVRWLFYQGEIVKGG